MVRYAFCDFLINIFSFFIHEGNLENYQMEAGEKLRITRPMLEVNPYKNVAEQLLFITDSPFNLCLIYLKLIVHAFIQSS